MKTDRVVGVAALALVALFAFVMTRTGANVVPSAGAQAGPAPVITKSAPDAPQTPLGGEGEMVVTRLSDTSFVVVKDHGLAQTTMFFVVEGGDKAVMKERRKYFYGN